VYVTTPSVQQFLRDSHIQERCQAAVALSGIELFLKKYFPNNAFAGVFHFKPGVACDCWAWTLRPDFVLVILVHM